VIVTGVCNRIRCARCGDRKVSLACCAGKRCCRRRARRNNHYERKQKSQEGTNFFHMIILLNLIFRRSVFIHRYFITKSKNCKYQGINYLYFRHYEQLSHFLLVVLNKMRFLMQNSEFQKSDKY
jgi:hypothetical protein